MSEHNYENEEKKQEDAKVFSRRRSQLQLTVATRNCVEGEGGAAFKEQALTIMQKDSRKLDNLFNFVDK